MNRGPLGTSSSSRRSPPASTCFLPSSWHGGWSPVDGFWLAWGVAVSGRPAGRAAWVDERLLAGAWSVLCWLVSWWSLPPPAPTAVAGFGAPIESAEDAGFPWPHIEEQHHLLTGDRDGVDVAVVTVSTMRSVARGRHGHVRGVLFLGDVLNMAEREMRIPCSC